MTNQPLKEQAQAAAVWIKALREEIGHVIVGQEQLVERLLVGLLANGHVLLEGVPGLAKTLSVRTLAAAVQASFHRIQFTPDLLPADIVGTLIYNPQDAKYHATRGPVFANFVLADEINRAPAKVQSALLEAMQERQVTLGGETMKLPAPFLVLATENPIDQEGTYPLPEAQVDRFMFKLRVGYSGKEVEKEIMQRMAGKELQALEVVAKPSEIFKARDEISNLYMDDKIADYIVNIVDATRSPSAYGLQTLAPLIEYGASPRATIFLAVCSRAHAYMRGRGYVLPEDVKAIGADVLRHRIITSYEAEAEEVSADDIVARIFEAVEVP